MTPNPPDESRARSPRRPTSPVRGIEVAGTLLPPLLQAIGPDQLDRMLLMLSVHAEGLGFDRAKLMVHEARSGRFYARWATQSPPSEMPIREALERVRFGTSDGVETSVVGVQESAAADLKGPAATAWNEEACVVFGTEPAHPRSKGGAIGAVALKRAGSNYALVVGEWRTPGDASERRARLQGFAAIAEWALAEQQRTLERRMRARQASAMAEMARATVSPSNLAEILHLASRLAAQAVGGRGSALWLMGPAGATKLEVAHGPAAARERIGRALQPLAGAVIAAGERRVVERPAEDPLLSPEAAELVTTAIVLPLAAYGRTLGAIAIYDRIRNHPGDPDGFAANDLEFLEGLADLTALAIEHAASFGAVAEAEHKNGELAARLVRQERLSTLGEMAARVVHEAKGPLASIRTFAKRARGALIEGAPEREYLEIVLREADRLERLLGEPTEMATVEPPTLELKNLNEIVQGTLQRVGETLVRRRIRLFKKLSPELPTLLVDGDRIGQMMSRILENALEAVSVGGRIRVETRRVTQHAVIEVAHDGPRSPGTALDHLFVPFAANRNGGEGIGLGLAQRIVREHGGEIRVRAEGEWSTIVAFTLPIAENQDRRCSTPDRRHGRNDRRARLPQQ